MKYDKEVRYVCGDDWRSQSQEERDGGFGVAMMVAYLQGASPNYEDIASSLGLSPREAAEASIPFRRLQVSGMFSDEFDALSDQALAGNASDVDVRTAWCQVAGTASGWLGTGTFITRDNRNDSDN
jgi:hypothetical protein